PEAQHRSIEIANLGLLEAKLLPRLPHRLEAARGLGIASIDGPLHRRRTGSYPFNLRRGIAQPSLGIAPIPGFDRTPHNLQVLVRHRLLLQAHGFEGLLVIKEVLDEDDATLTVGADLCEALLPLNAALLPANIPAGTSEDSISEIHDLLETQV